MGNEMNDEIIDASPIAEEKPQVQITSQELLYMYTVLYNSNVPAKDSTFVANLLHKLETALNIQPQQRV